MKKRIAAALAAVILMISLFSACSHGGAHSAYEEIYERYNNLESFYAEAKITAINSRSKNVYCVRQFYAAPDKFSLVVDSPEEVAGSGYVFSGGSYTVRSGFGKDESVEIGSPDGKNALLLADFFSAYYKSESASAEAGKGFSGGVTVMECLLESRNERQFKQKLFIDNKTFLPIRLETYDINGDLSFTVEYTEFKRNCRIDESNFN